jgi:hypothetical protein
MAFTAKVQGQAMDGAFTFDKSSFPFTAVLKDDTLTLTTDDTKYVLQRAIETTKPRNQLNKPKNPLNPTHPDKPSNPIKPAIPTGSAAPKIGIKAWSRFPQGTFAQYTETTTLNDKPPTQTNERLIYLETRNGDELLNRLEMVDGKWHPSGVELPWQKYASTLETMGFSAKSTRQESLKVGTESLRCEVTTYVIKRGSGFKTTDMKLDVWRSANINLPSHILAFPGTGFLVDNHTVRLVLDAHHQGQKGTVDYKLTNTKGTATISGKIVRVSTFDGAYSFGDKNFDPIKGEVAHDIAAGIPGGLVRYKHKRTQGKAQKVVVRKLDSFGQGDTPK